MVCVLTKPLLVVAILVHVKVANGGANHLEIMLIKSDRNGFRTSHQFPPDTLQQQNGQQ